MELNQQRAQITDLQTSIKNQQEETAKSKEVQKAALTSMEQLKENFKTERANWLTEKEALKKRAEDAEAALKPEKGACPD